MRIQDQVTPEALTSAVPAKAWRMLALGVSAQAAGTFLISAPAYLIVLLHTEQGFTLTQGGILASAPTFGMVLTLVLWGAAADRYGEREVIALGSALTAVFALAAAFAPNIVWMAILLMLGGAAAASANAASGRVVVGWFPKHRRGLAMGIRQMSQPLGVAIAALVVPPVAAHISSGAALLVAAVLTAVLAIASWVGIENPPRPAASQDREGLVRPANPYRRDAFLARIHALSLLLVVPQFTLSIFGLAWLTIGLGWSAASAGVVIAASQFIGALGRIVIGHASDRVGSRVRVLRWVAVAGVAALLALAGATSLHWSALAAILFVIATTISVADNGLAFTSVAEASGPAWSGRALGIQNTGQFIAASAVGPGIGALITVAGYPLALAAVAITPLAAIVLIPRRDQSYGDEGN